MAFTDLFYGGKMTETSKDAWKLKSELEESFTLTLKPRGDLKAEGFGTDRCVKLTLRKENPSYGPPTYLSTTRNVSTMRELAAAIIEACDYVDSVNPTWASHDFSGPITFTEPQSEDDWVLPVE